MFYFTLANIHPKFRSKLRGIQLLALCKQKYLKTYGINAILHPLIEDIKKLVSEYLTYIATITAIHACIILTVYRKVVIVLRPLMVH